MRDRRCAWRWRTSRPPSGIKRTRRFSRNHDMRRRTFLTTAAAGLAQIASGQSVPEAIQKLKPMMAAIEAITDDERRARIEKARRLMRENKLGAIVLEGGSSLFYFTGTRWPQSER